MYHRTIPLCGAYVKSRPQEALYLKRCIVCVLYDIRIRQIGDYRSGNRLALREVNDMHIAEIIGVGEKQHFERGIFHILCDAELDVRLAVSFYINR